MAGMRIRVWKFAVLCGTVLCLWLTEAIPATAGPCSEQGEAPGIFVPDRGCFSLGIGYQYQHYNVLGTRFHNNGYNASFGMHLFDLVTGGAGRLTAGIEGEAASGFGGHTGGNPSLEAKSFFLGGGPHIALENGSRFEPWIHGLVGWERLRFTQTGTLGANSALGYMVGGGLDIRLAQKISWRIQGDYLGTHFQSGLQSNYSTGTGIVLHF
ncbi:MAG TPA: hypothetical protein VK770_13540 [Candidatus Acidoferrum sp.]|jgi:hypothetical protein|nr:hypothetical protein [Candidatus Acidoferrum sp.]